MPFTDCVELILKHEGGYVNDPRDPGGETKYGISKRSYPHLDIKNLTKKEAREIYRHDFWDYLHCDEMPEWIALPVLDMAVNSGQGTAIRMLQSVLGTTVDGIIGPKTLAAAQHANAREVLYYTERRIEYYSNISGWKTFGKHWRMRSLRTYQRALAIFLASKMPRDWEAL